MKDIEKFQEIEKFNTELNKFKYGVLINDKVVTKNIDWNKYKTIPINKMEKYKVGICWDIVNYAYDWFKKHKIPADAYFIAMQKSDKPDDIQTHTFIIFKFEGERYWFESAWSGYKGIYNIGNKKFGDIEEYFIKKYGNHPYSIFKYNPTGLDNNLTSEQFFNKVTKSLVKDVKESMSIHVSGNEVKFVQEAESKLVSEATILYEQCEANEIGLLALDEGLREVLEEYITKIREGMNKAFEKLKQIIEEKQNKVLKLILEQVQNDPKDPDFTIDNYCTYDTNKLLNSYKILPLEYDVMKDDLIESKQNFLQKYYPNCYDPELSIKEKIMKDVKSQPSDTRCTNEMLVNMINFCLEGYKPIYDQIEQDKELISKSCDAIKAVADSIDTTVQQTGGADVRQATGESVLFFLEADEKQDKLGFKDDPNAKAKNASPAKVVSTWCSVVTSIYSAKMKVLNTMRSDYYRILVHHARLRGWSLVPPKK